MVEDVLYLIREVIAWFKGRRPSDEAVTTLLQALHATEAYISDRAKSGEDRRRESELVSLWTECAVLLRHSNPSLANLLKDKARSWAVPEEYEHSDIQKLGIDIESIRKEADSIFGTATKTVSNARRRIAPAVERTETAKSAVPAAHRHNIRRLGTQPCIASVVKVLKHATLDRRVSYGLVPPRWLWDSSLPTPTIAPASNNGRHPGCRYSHGRVGN